MPQIFYSHAHDMWTVVSDDGDNIVYDSSDNALKAFLNLVKATNQNMDKNCCNSTPALPERTAFFQLLDRLGYFVDIEGNLRDNPISSYSFTAINGQDFDLPVTAREVNQLRRRIDWLQQRIDELQKGDSANFIGEGPTLSQTSTSVAARRRRVRTKSAATQPTEIAE